jgi:hypothetical protein
MTRIDRRVIGFGLFVALVYLDLFLALQRWPPH